MSFRNVQGNNVPARSLSASAGRQAAPAPWVRNPAWPALTAPTSGEQKLVGLHAVWPGDGVGNGGNFFAVNCAANYTVDFGDGTSVNTATGVRTNHEYNFADVDLYDATVTLTDAGDLVGRTAHGYSNGMRVQFYRIVNTTGLVEAQFYFVINATANDFQVAATEGGAALALTTDGSASLLPYKIATVAITPQAGQNLTTVNLFVKNTTTGLQAYSTGWLELAIAGSNITALTISSTSTTLRHSYIESVNIVELGAVTTFANLLQNCIKLQNVSINVPATVTNMNAMFSYCYSLTTVPLFNTASVTNMTSMFNGCSALTAVPLFNTAAVTSTSSMFNSCFSLTAVPLFNTAAVTNMSSMFNGCRSLVAVPLFNTAAVTTMTSMFNSCYVLTTVPLFNTAAVTSMNGMFNNCFSLVAVPLFNTAAVTNMGTMLSGCFSLTAVPLFNTAAVRDMTYMFSSCNSLTTVPLFNTAAVTTMRYMFNSCYSLTTVPLFNTAAVTSMRNMFYNCFSLATVPLFNTAAVTDMRNMFYLCSSLTTVPALVTTAVTSSADFSSIFTNCNSLARIQAEDFRFTFSVASCKLSAAALDEIYTNLPVVVAQTITVTGNYGTTGDDPTIATAKGWTVTG
jgi:surface protein